jgi:LysR family glycine cleavage system transcriptional activator
VDVVVRFGPGGSPGYPAHILALDSVVAVAAPGLGGGALPRWPEDLARFPLIHQAELPWSLWLERAGLSELPAAAGVDVDDLGMGIGLAKAGLGVALAPEMLVRSELQTGGLVRLFERAPVFSEGYQATWNPGSPKQSIIRTFVDWLRAEIDTSRVEHFAERAAGLRAYG